MTKADLKYIIKTIWRGSVLIIVACAGILIILTYMLCITGFFGPAPAWAAASLLMLGLCYLAGKARE